MDKENVCEGDVDGDEGCMGCGCRERMLKEEWMKRKDAEMWIKRMLRRC